MNPKASFADKQRNAMNLGINKGTFWSPKGNLLAFYRMDESMGHNTRCL